MSSLSDNRFYSEELRKLAKELDDEKRKNTKLEQFIEIINVEDKQRGGREN